MNPSWDDEFLTVMQVAEHLQLNQQTVRNWIDAGTLPAVRIGRRVRLRRADVEKLITDAATTDKDASRGGKDRPSEIAPAVELLSDAGQRARRLLGRRTAARRADLASGLQDLADAVDAALEQLPGAEVDD